MKEDCRLVIDHPIKLRPEILEAEFLFLLLFLLFIDAHFENPQI